MYWHKNPYWFQYVWPRFTWRRPVKEKILYLTFDDGPIPDITEWVLDVLAKYGAKGTFFCVGDNIRKHPAVFQKVRSAGHAVGNHTFNHLNGRKTACQPYLDNTALCQQYLGQTTGLFRPPHGRITGPQANALLQNYQVVMWDVLTGDFDRSLPRETCLRKTIRATEAGSIVVFHDSLKAQPNLEFVLPRFLEHFSEKGYRFHKL